MKHQRLTDDSKNPEWVGNMSVYNNGDNQLIVQTDLSTAALRIWIDSHGRLYVSSVTHPLMIEDRGRVRTL